MLHPTLGCAALKQDTRVEGALDRIASHVKVRNGPSLLADTGC